MPCHLQILAAVAVESKELCFLPGCDPNVVVRTFAEPVTDMRVALPALRIAKHHNVWRTTVKEAAG